MNRMDVRQAFFLLSFIILWIFFTQSPVAAFDVSDTWHKDCRIVLPESATDTDMYCENITSSSRIPIVLIHGDNSEKRAYAGWYQNNYSFVQYVRDNPSLFSKFDIYVWYHDTSKPIGFNGSSGNALELSNFIKNVIAPKYTPGTKVILVAHSRGGLVSRSFMNYRDPATNEYMGDKYVQGLITLGTPHHGSPGALPDWAAKTWKEKIHPFITLWEPIVDLGFFLINPANILLPEQRTDNYSRSFFNYLYNPTDGVMDTDRQGTLNLAWDNVDGGISATSSTPLDDFSFNVVIANNGTLTLTECDTNKKITGCSTKDKTIFYSDSLKNGSGTLYELNQNERYKDKIVTFAAFDDDLWGNVDLFGLFQEKVTGHGLDDHEKLGIATFIMASMTGTGTNVYYANDGFVPLQSALFLDISGGIPFASVGNERRYIFPHNNIFTRKQTKNIHIYTGDIKNHLGLLDTANRDYWDTLRDEIIDFVAAPSFEYLKIGDFTLPEQRDYQVRNKNENNYIYAVAKSGLSIEKMEVSIDGQVVAISDTFTQSQIGSIAYTWDTSSLAIGWYEVGVKIHDRLGRICAYVFDLYLYDSPITPIPRAEPSSFTFNMEQGATSVESQYLKILNAGGGTFNWSIPYSPYYMTLSATSGSGPSTLIVGINDNSGLPVGTDSRQIIIYFRDSDGTYISEQTIPVTVVVSANQILGKPTPIADTYVRINGTNSSDNYGTSTSILVGGEPIIGGYSLVNGFVKFDVSSLIGKSASIIDAKLRLYCSSSPEAGTVHVKRVTTNWSETTLTGNSAINVIGDEFILINGGSTGWKEWPVKSFVKDWANNIPNYGLMLQATNGSYYYTFNSREASLNKPELLVTLCEGTPNIILSTPRPDNGSTVPPFYVGQTVTWYVTVSNTGSGCAPSYRVLYYLGNSPTDTSTPIDNTSTGANLVGGKSVTEKEAYAFAATGTNKYLVAKLEGSTDKIVAYGPFDIIRKPSLSAAPEGLNFTGLQGGPNPFYQGLNITNTGDGALNWSASSSVPWLTVTPSTGQGSGGLRASVDMTGLAAGQYDGNIVIAATGALNNPATIPVSLTIMAEPEINVQQGSRNILDGSGIYDFGSVAVGSSKNISFTIQNLGYINLSLSGNPIVTVKGSNASDFTIIAQPDASVSPSGTTTFTVRYTPSSTGSRTATISIINSDSDETLYEFTLTGTDAAPGTINVDTSPGDITSFWTLIGPNGFSQLGSGNQKLVNLSPGDYTLTWENVNGWNKPTPISSTQPLAPGGAITFSGTYSRIPATELLVPVLSFPADGSLYQPTRVIMSWIDPNTDPKVMGYQVRWKMEGDASYSESIVLIAGTTSDTLTNLVPGKKYSWSVRAIGNGLTTANSVYSTDYSFVVDSEQRGTTTRVSVASDGTQGNADSYPRKISISADGRYVAFPSNSSNLVSDDTNGQADIFVHDRQTGQTTRVSVASDGTQGNGYSDWSGFLGLQTNSPSLSADGRYVAFVSGFTNLARGDTNGMMDIFVHDRQTGQTTRVSVASDGTQGNDFSYNPSISADGRYVAFESGSSNLVSNDTNGQADIFVHDRQTGQTTCVSVASDGTQGNDFSYNPSISADGRYVAFESGSSNLVSNDTNGRPDIFVHDRQTGQTTRVSVASDGTQESSGSYDPSISANGRYVVFASDGINLLADATTYTKIFVHDRQTGQTTFISRAYDGTQGNESSFIGMISADGRYVAFESWASNIVPSDDYSQPWGYQDVFVHDRQTGQTKRVSVASDGTEGDGEVDNLPAISADGRYVAFGSWASNLVSNDTNDTYDIFVYKISEKGTIVIRTHTSALHQMAPWILAGPNGYSQSGIGDQVLTDLYPGEYTVTWGDSMDWVKPSPATETKTLTRGWTTTFTGNYGVSYKVPGDLDNDGQVTIADAIIGLKVLAGGNVDGLLRSNYTVSGVDVDNNGKVGLAEVIYILQRVAGLR